MDWMILIRGWEIMASHYPLLAVAVVAMASGALAGEDAAMPYYRVQYHVEADDRIWNGIRSEYRKTGKFQAFLQGEDNPGQRLVSGPMEYVSGPRGMTRFTMRESTAPLAIDLDPERISPRGSSFINMEEGSILVLADYFGGGTGIRHTVILESSELSARHDLREVSFHFLSGLDIDREGFLPVSDNVLFREVDNTRETLVIDPETGMPSHYTRIYTGGGTTAPETTSTSGYERQFDDYKEVAPGLFIPHRAEFTVSFNDRAARIKKMTVQSVEVLDEAAALKALTVETGEELLRGMDNVKRAGFRHEGGTVDPLTIHERITYR